MSIIAEEVANIACGKEEWSKNYFMRIIKPFGKRDSGCGCPTSPLEKEHMAKWVNELSPRYFNLPHFILFKNYKKFLGRVYLKLFIRD
jgi:hypothetical protein